MAETKSGDQSTGTADRPATQAKRAESTPQASSGTFADGSTQEQQDQLVREAEETNRLIKEAGNAEREARGG
jgi:hypothetical protein